MTENSCYVFTFLIPSGKLFGLSCGDCPNENSYRSMTRAFLELPHTLSGVENGKPLKRNEKNEKFDILCRISVEARRETNYGIAVQHFKTVEIFSFLIFLSFAFRRETFHHRKFINERKFHFYHFERKDLELIASVSTPNNG